MTTGLIDEELMDDIVSENVERAVDDIAASIAARDGKWNLRLLCYTGNYPIFMPEMYADAYSNYDFDTTAIGTVAFDDEVDG